MKPSVKMELDIIEPVPKIEKEIFGPLKFWHQRFRSSTKKRSRHYDLLASSGSYHDNMLVSSGGKSSLLDQSVSGKVDS